MSATNTGSWGDGFQNLFFDAARVKLGVQDRASDVEQVTDDRNIPDSVDLKYNQRPTTQAQNFGLQNKKLIIGSVVAAGGFLYLLLRKGKK